MENRSKYDDGFQKGEILKQLTPHVRVVHQCTKGKLNFSARDVLLVNYGTVKLILS